MKIVVTELDIADGIRGAFDECPVALAVKSRYRCVSVGLSGDILVRASACDDWKVLTLRLHTRIYIALKIMFFDAFRYMTPFEFETLEPKAKPVEAKPVYGTMEMPKVKMKELIHER